MKTLKEYVNESIIFEGKYSQYKNWDDVFAIAKQNKTFKESNGNGRKFEIMIGDAKLVVVFEASREVRFYEFFDKQENSLFYSGSSTFYVDEVDWDMLINNTQKWISLMQDEMDDHLKSWTRAAKSAAKKYERSGRYEDKNMRDRYERNCTAVQFKIDQLKNLIKLIAK